MSTKLGDIYLIKLIFISILYKKFILISILYFVVFYISDKTHIH